MRLIVHRPHISCMQEDKSILKINHQSWTSQNYTQILFLPLYFVSIRFIKPLLFGMGYSDHISSNPFAHVLPTSDIETLLFGDIFFPCELVMEPQLTECHIISLLGLVPP